MTELKAQVQLTMTLGVLSLFAGVMGHLALTDIYHGNGDLSLEWNVLRACAVVLVVFIGSTLFTLRQVLKRL
jgi:hypothetical protein